MPSDTSNDTTATARVVTPAHTPPEGASATLRWQQAEVSASAGWIVLRRDESPSAEVFVTSYVIEDGDAATGSGRPITFVFNGGPGASSAFLHMGGLGPRRVVIPDDGSLPRMPVEVVDNADSWLAFTDLVFVDPVGTGFSRMIPESDGGGRSDGPASPAQAGVPGTGGAGADASRTGEADGERSYLTFSSDLAAMSETVSRWLSANNRWTSPIFLAGESYGGYRVARLAKTLQADEGVGLAGAVMISPAIEITPLTATDYALEPFIDPLPTMAVAALHHGRSRAGVDDAEQLMADAHAFARGPYVQFLAQGSAMPSTQRQAVLGDLADLLGLPQSIVEHHRGRLRIDTFTRELLRDEHRVIGLYDTAVVGDDPFPDRGAFEGPDATLHGFSAAFTSAANHVIRGEIGVETDRRYQVLSMKVNEGWRADTGQHALSVPPGAADDLRYGLSLNPHMRVLITHGRHDLVTPSHGSVRIIDQIASAAVRERVELRRYDGGHMYYSWADSRERSTSDTASFYRRCLASAA